MLTGTGLGDRLAGCCEACDPELASASNGRSLSSSYQVDSVIVVRNSPSLYQSR